MFRLSFNRGSTNSRLILERGFIFLLYTSTPFGDCPLTLIDHCYILIRTHKDTYIGSHTQAGRQTTEKHTHSFKIAFLIPYSTWLYCRNAHSNKICFEKACHIGVTVFHTYPSMHPTSTNSITKHIFRAGNIFTTGAAH